MGEAAPEKMAMAASGQLAMAWGAEGASMGTDQEEGISAVPQLYQAVSGGGVRGYQMLVVFEEEEEEARGEDTERSATGGRHWSFGSQTESIFGNVTTKDIRECDAQNVKRTATQHSMRKRCHPRHSYQKKEDDFQDQLLDHLMSLVGARERLSSLAQPADTGYIRRCQEKRTSESVGCRSQARGMKARDLVLDRDGLEQEGLGVRPVGKGPGTQVDIAAAREVHRCARLARALW